MSASISLKSLGQDRFSIAQSRFGVPESVAIKSMNDSETTLGIHRSPSPLMSGTLLITPVQQVVPRMLNTSPSSHAPRPNAAQETSTPPMTTTVSALNPVRLATSSVILPAISVLFLI
ncbi:hypothetical protein BQ6471_02429 [Vibrio gazogenes]|nr:hypothetical protein BQ6471_02429 [Vibrio gazogenes]